MFTTNLGGIPATGSVRGGQAKFRVSTARYKEIVIMEMTVEDKSVLGRMVG